MDKKMAVLVVMGAGLAGCGGDMSTGDLGVVPGGAQDIGYARQVIEDGGVPTADSFNVNGLLNEHDMPLAGETPCQASLCLAAATGRGVLDTTAEGGIWLQIGYDTAITEESFVRPPLNLAVVVDGSGSMSDDLPAMQLALHEMVDQLEPGDRLAIVVYASTAKVVLDSTDAIDADKLHKAIDKMKTGGSTDMESGLREGFEALEPHRAEGVESRLLLFTDVQPNVGATAPSEFEELVAGAAADGMGLTLFGIGSSFGAGLALAISDYRGGNYVYLADADAIEEVFNEDFDYLVTPIGYDLQMTVSSELPFEEAWNVQAQAGDGAGELVKVNVATLFISKGHGATLLRFDTPDSAEMGDGEEVASLALSYEERDGRLTEDALVATLGTEVPGYRGDGFQQPGVRKGAALVNMGSSMLAVCEAFHAQEALPEDAYRETVARLEHEAEALDDDALRTEVALLQKLAENAGISLEE